jgi:hypothetical protein
MKAVRRRRVLTAKIERAHASCFLTSEVVLEAPCDIVAVQNTQHRGAGVVARGSATGPENVEGGGVEEEGEGKMALGKKKSC